MSYGRVKSERQSVAGRACRSRIHEITIHAGTLEPPPRRRGASGRTRAREIERRAAHAPRVNAAVKDGTSGLGVNFIAAALRVTEIRERGRRVRTKEAGITARITGGYERGIVGERACMRASRRLSARSRISERKRGAIRAN